MDLDEPLTVYLIALLCILVIFIIIGAYQRCPKYQKEQALFGRNFGTHWLNILIWPALQVHYIF